MSDTPDVSALACPFCGNSPSIGRSSDGHMWIACESKGCGIAETYMSKDRDAVLAMWNRRAATALTAQAERIAELEAGGEKLRNFAWKVGSMSEKRLPTWKWASLQDQARALLEEKTS